MSKQALGKGLSALIPTSKETEVHQSTFKTLAVDSIEPNPMQPRREFDSEQLQELAASLKANGIMQPLVVKKNGGNFVIVAGERRYRAARLAGIEAVPAIVMDDIDDTRMLELALVENIHREDLNPLELADAYRRLMSQCGLTQQQLSERVGKSRASIANHVRLLNLPESIKRLIASGKLTEGHARAILSLDNEADMLAMAQQIVSGEMSVRASEEATSKRKRRRPMHRRKNPALTEFESYLKRVMGTSVRVVPGPKKGRIEIEYYTDDDLQRLWDVFKRLES